ncbi:MAG: MJ1255/VC2487 family glycosyltransferase, partial [Pseudomonadota bacterium]
MKKLFYGVQATGQGHISRARAMANALLEHDVEVTWLFSGRPREALFDMAMFGDYEHRQGLTFATRGGRIRYLQTAAINAPLRFLRDVRELDLTSFDLVVCDFEPVTAWAARRAGRPTIGIGHQYAFGPGTPVAGANWLSTTIMRNFAPVTTPLGLHWHDFAPTVLPPILDLPDMPCRHDGAVLVYLPFEDQDKVTELLHRFQGIQFVQYSPELVDAQSSNVALRKASFDKFKVDLAASSGVICNAGFELISECLQWRKPVLAKPLHGQMEQLSNAQALDELGLSQF